MGDKRFALDTKLLLQPTARQRARRSGGPQAHEPTGEARQRPGARHGQGLRGQRHPPAGLDLGFDPVVPPKSSRVDPWEYNRELYKRRNEVERLFQRLKGFRRIFSRFEKLDVMFLGFIVFALIVVAWSPTARSQEFSQQQTGLTDLKIQTIQPTPKALRIRPSFDPAQDSYQLKVSSRLNELTILGFFDTPQMGLRCLHHEDSLVADSDPHHEGCQVSINPGVNRFLLEAIGKDKKIQKTYSLSVLRNSLAAEPQTLVSNLNQSDSSNAFRATRHIAQYFTTPYDGDGYELHGIKIRTGAGQMGPPDMALYSVDESKDVSQRLFDLSPPQTLGAREPSFSAPPDAILEAGSTYAIYLRRNSRDLILDATRSNLEGQKASPGWEIEDRYYFRQGARWVRNRSNSSLRIAVEGTPFTTQSQDEVNQR